MATAAQVLKLRRGTTAENNAFTGANAEVTVDTDVKTLVLHDGVTVGGNRLIDETSLAASTGAGGVGFIQAGAGAVARTVESKVRDHVHQSDYTGTAPIAIQAAIDYLATGIGGTVELPQVAAQALGTTGLAVPAGVVLNGKGVFGTRLTYSGAGTAIAIGGTSGVQGYGGGFTNAKINLNNDAAKGVTVKGLAGAVVQNSYIEGNFGATNATTAVEVDAGNISAFFNVIMNITANHVKKGFTVTTTGTGASTCQLFAGCSAAGDYSYYPGMNSIGFDVGHPTITCGNGTVWLAGNLENCGIGMRYQAGGIGVSAFGPRFEGNNNDITFDLYSKACAVIGAHGLDTITDNSGGGYGNHMLWGNFKSDGSPQTNKVWGESRFYANLSTTTPVVIYANPTQTGDLLKLVNSSGSPMQSVTADGAFGYAVRNTVGASDGFNFAGSYNRLRANSGDMDIESYHGVRIALQFSGAGTPRFVIAKGASYTGGTPTEMVYLDNTGWIPAVDNTYNLGSAAKGWKELFCDNGIINTSDARLKTPIQYFSDKEIAASKVLAKEIGSFKFLQAVKEKGDKARTHIGVTVQRVIEVMELFGLDPMAYGFICYDEWGDAFEDGPDESILKAQQAERLAAVDDWLKARVVKEENDVSLRQAGIKRGKDKADADIDAWVERPKSTIAKAVKLGNAKAAEKASRIQDERVKGAHLHRDTVTNVEKDRLRKLRQEHKQRVQEISAEAEKRREAINAEFWEFLAKPVEPVQRQWAGNKYGLRYEEFAMFLARGFEARLAALEASA